MKIQNYMTGQKLREFMRETIIADIREGTDGVTAEDYWHSARCQDRLCERRYALARSVPDLVAALEDIVAINRKPGVAGSPTEARSAFVAKAAIAKARRELDEVCERGDKEER